VDATRAVSGVESSQDWLSLQSHWTQRFTVIALEQAAKLSGLSGKASREAAEPIQAHVSDAIGKLPKCDQRRDSTAGVLVSTGVGMFAAWRAETHGFPSGSKHSTSTVEHVVD
jgi:hypothetical protein